MTQIYQKVKSVIANYPSYKVVELDQENCVTNLIDGDQLYLDQRTYTIGSVISRAIKRNADPLKAYNLAIKNKHETHYIFANASTLSMSKREQKTVINVTLGMRVKFEEIVFEILKAPNNNLRLKRILEN